MYPFFIVIENYAGSKVIFEYIIQEAENYFSRNISASDKEKLTTLYVAVLSNAALAASHLNQIEDSLQFSEKALQKNPTHLKCLFRKSLCKIIIGDKMRVSGDDLGGKQKQLEVYEEARFSLEALLKLDNQNAEVKDKLSNLIGTIVKLRKEISALEQQASKPKESQGTSKKTEVPKTDFLQKVHENATGLTYCFLND